MDPQPDVIRQQIEETRSSLTEKLETLEAEVMGTVQSAKETVESAKETVQETLTTAKETVQETISSVKETVQSATDTVKQTFDIPYQVNRHPWAMMGLSLVSGVIAGALVAPRLSSGRRVARRMSEASYEPPLREEATPRSAWSRLTHGEPGRPGFMDKLTEQLADEVEKAKDLAIKTLVGVVDNVVQRSIPVLGSAVEDLMARAAANVGAHPQQHGEPCREPAAGTGYQAPPMY